MKKMMAVLLAFVMMLAVLSACGGTTSTGDTNKPQAKSSSGPVSWSGPDVPVQDASAPGNSASNLNNGGTAVRIGDWIIGNWNGKLCKFRPDGTQVTVLSPYPGYYINVVGDTIYFLPETDGDSAILHVKTDGTGGADFYGRYAYCLAVRNNLMYFVDQYGQINQLKLDNTGLVALSSPFASIWFAVTDDRLFYIDADQVLVSADLTGKSLQYPGGKIPVNVVLTCGSRVVYLQPDGTACSMKPDGSDIKQIATGVKRLAADDKLVYYIDGNSMLYSAKPDGSGKPKQLYDKKVNNTLQIAGDTLLFTEGSNMTFIKADGSGAKTVDMTK